MISRHLTNLFIILLSLSHFFVQGHFGVTKERDEIIETRDFSEEELINLTEKEAYEIRALIEAAGSDPETIKLVAKLKDENGHELDELKSIPQDQLIMSLKKALEDLKMIDLLFRDKERALVELEKEGLIPKQNIKHYKKNPDLLEDDLRKGLYFNFISLAVVGGYL